jgi:hypothetical protein
MSFGLSFCRNYRMHHCDSAQRHLARSGRHPPRHASCALIACWLSTAPGFRCQSCGGSSRRIAHACRPIRCMTCAASTSRSCRGCSFSSRVSPAVSVSGRPANHWATASKPTRAGRLRAEPQRGGRCRSGCCAPRQQPVHLPPAGRQQAVLPSCLGKTGQPWHASLLPSARCRLAVAMTASVKGFRTPAEGCRWCADGRRPKSLEGGNRGEVREGAGASLW